MGDEIPFSGVLISRPRYMTKEADLAAYRFMLDNPPPCKEESNISKYLTVGIFSFSIGALAVVFAK